MTTNSPSSLPALLRHVSLQASLLAQGAATSSVAQLRIRCQETLNELASTLEERRVPVDAARDILYLQCGLLDEMVLTHLSPQSRAQWEARPLQVERFNKYDAGEYVFIRLAERMRESPPNIALLECYATVLGLGFRGRYARDGEAPRAATIRELNNQLAKIAPSQDAAMAVDATRTRALLHLLYRMPAWAIAGLACVAAAIVFMRTGQNLDLHVSQFLAAYS